MRVLQIGAAKSGNFWLYRIIKSMMELDGLEFRSFIQNQPIFPIAKRWPLSNEDQAGLDFIDITPLLCFYRISSIFRMPIEDFDAYLSQVSIVRSHSRFQPRNLAPFQKFEKIVYIIRDPRDVAISFSKFAFTPYYRKFYPHAINNPEEFLSKTLERRLWGWMHHVISYLSQRDNLGLHILFYEGLKHNFHDEIRALGEYLELDLDSSQIQKVREQTSLETMKASNPDHVRRGSAGGWATSMSGKLQLRSRFSTAPILRNLGYPLRIGDYREGDLPSISPSVSNRKLQLSLQMSRIRTALSAGLSANLDLPTILKS